MILGAVPFPNIFRIGLSMFKKKKTTCWDFYRNGIKLMDIFTMSSLLIHEHDMSLHLFQLSLISFMSILYFSACGFCTYLTKCIHKYFIFFGVIIKGTVFLISVCTCSLLVYKNVMICVCQSYILQPC